jgi:hypothetical protein
MKRYRYYKDSFGAGRLLEHPKGEWIKYDEHEEIVETKYSDEEVADLMRHR